MSYEIQRRESDNAWLTIGWPAVRDYLGGGELLILPPDDQTLTLLDQNCGIDWLQVLPCGAMRALAVRMQKDYDYRGFSVRLRSEYHKRRRDIANDYVYPSYTIQGFYSGNELLSIGVAKTVDLYRFLADWREQGNQLPILSAPNGDKFITVSWFDFETKYDLWVGTGQGTTSLS